MKICMICEGCYPYVVGGVSSWVQQLIQNMPEHNFSIMAIAPTADMRGNYKYELPDNLLEVHEVFLDDIFKEAKGFRQVKIPKEYKAIFKKLILNQKFDYRLLFDYFKNTPFRIPDILMSEDFYDIAVEVYHEKYNTTRFAKFLWTLRSMYMTLFYILKQELPVADAYHTVATGYAGVLGGMGRHFSGKPLIISEHGIYTREREEEIIKADWIDNEFKDLWIDYFYIMSDIAYTFVDKAVSLFERSRQIQINLGCDATKTSVIANGIDPTRFDDAPPKDAKDVYINIGAVLRVTPIKDVKTMIYAFNMVKKRVDNVKLYIMGPCDEDIDYFLECKHLVEVLKIKDVLFTERIMVKDYINKMDIILLTSVSEGQPLSILEGFASAKPCVSTNVGCCNELIYGNDDGIGDAGYVLPIMDYESIASALVTLCKNPEKRTQMGQNGKKRLETLYTEKKFLQDYRDLYALFDIPN